MSCNSAREIHTQVTPVPVYEEVKPPLLQDFTSLGELEQWLRSDNISKEHSYCGPRALALIRKAELDGYRLHLDVITYWEYNSKYGDSWPYLYPGDAHAVCSAVIGDEIYYIEPLTTTVWYHGRLMRHE